MRISAQALRRQYELVVTRGWWRYLEEAARRYFPDGEFDAPLLFAIGSRETNWNPRYLQEPGDGGRGFGPMQIDIGSYPEWIATGAWKNPRESIMKGAEVLRDKLVRVRAGEGKPIRVTWHGRLLTMTGKVLSPEERRAVAIASYNCGAWSMWHVSKGRSPDHGTTGGDYSADVLERARVARGWAPATAMRPCPTCGGTGEVPA